MNAVLDRLPDRTVVFGYDARRRLWSGEGVKQHAALHIKHLDYLRESTSRPALPHVASPGQAWLTFLTASMKTFPRQ